MFWFDHSTPTWSPGIAVITEMSSVFTPAAIVIGELHVVYGESLQRTLMSVVASDASHMRPSESMAIVAVSTPLSRVVAVVVGRVVHAV